jgi:hypothetical protein
MKTLNEMLKTVGSKRLRSTEKRTARLMAECNAKRDIFGELMEGVSAMKRHRAGKHTLLGYKFEASPLPRVDSKTE